jgi:hypothetical protein
MNRLPVYMVNQLTIWFVVLSNLGRGEGRDCINNRLITIRSRDRDVGVVGSDGRKGESTFLGRINLCPRRAYRLVFGVETLAVAWSSSTT